MTPPRGRSSGGVIESGTETKSAESTTDANTNAEPDGPNRVRGVSEQKTENDQESKHQELTVSEAERMGILADQKLYAPVPPGMPPELWQKFIRTNYDIFKEAYKKKQDQDASDTPTRLRRSQRLRTQTGRGLEATANSPRPRRKSKQRR